MSTADRAYEAAKRLIAEAKQTGAHELSFERPNLRTLETLPPEIASLVDVEYLNLNCTRIADLSSLSRLTGLKAINLDGTRVADLKPITDLIGIRGIELRDTLVSDLAPLSGLIEMTALYLDNTLVTDLAPLAGLTKIQELALTGTQVSDLRPLAGLRDMRLLMLGGTQITDLSPIYNMNALYGLHLERTRVTDLSPLTSMGRPFSIILNDTAISDLTPLIDIGGIYDLSLNNTAIVDLRPARAFPKLTEIQGYLGLQFRGCAAARADPRIAEIAEIKDNAERARTLFDYLKDWVPPIPEDRPEAPGFTMPDQGPMHSVDQAPTDGDEDQLGLQHDLIRKSAMLMDAIAASNDMAALKDSSAHYQKQIDKPLALIRLGLLYSAANTLRVAYEAEMAAQQAGRINDTLPPKVAAALKDLVETHGLFFMGFPNAAAIHAKMLAGLTGRRNPEVLRAAEAVVMALEGKVVVLDREDQAAMADELAAAKGKGPSAEIGERRLFARLQNMATAFGRWVYATSRAGVKLTFETVSKHDVIAWFMEQQTIVAAFLKSVAGHAPAWFNMVLELTKSPF